MSETQTTVNTDQPAVADTVVVTTTPTEGDAESRIAALEEEKNKAIAEAANYKVAFLKAKSDKEKENFADETDEERTRRLVQEELSKTKITAIEKEKEDLLAKLAKENKELKLAHLNKTTPAATVGTHSEGQTVQDTLITPEQMIAFKKMGWDDKTIERYKKNLHRYSGR